MPFQQVKPCIADWDPSQVDAELGADADLMTISMVWLTARLSDYLAAASLFHGLSRCLITSPLPPHFDGLSHRLTASVITSLLPHYFHGLSRCRITSLLPRYFHGLSHRLTASVITSLLPHHFHDLSRCLTASVITLPLPHRQT